MFKLLKSFFSVLFQTALFRKMIFMFVQLWISSLRIRLSPSVSNLDQTLIVFWHTHLLVVVSAFQKQNFHVMISASKDGDFLTKICQKRGFVVCRGSSSRQALTATREMLRSVKTSNLKKKFSMALDGPRGPAEKVSIGAPWLARKLKIPVLIIDAKCLFYFRLPTWDRTMIPFPFSRVEVTLDVFKNRSNIR